MYAKFSESIDVMAVITDKKNKKSSVYNVDTIQLARQIIQCTPTKTAQFFFALGCLDELEEFHLFPELAEKVAIVTLDSQAYDKYFSNKLYLTEEDMKEIYKEYIPRCNISQWKFLDRDIEFNSEIIFEAQ
jgi:nicotinic acid mononucleotide adenylyltransferase